MCAYDFVFNTIAEGLQIKCLTVIGGAPGGELPLAVPYRLLL